jgi:hypothetical protein
MSYEEKLKALSQFSMDDFIAISKELLPSEYRACPWHYINHGVDLLSTEDQLCAYIAAYGEMHHVKCKASFQNFNFEAISTNVEIIDWGCGQGIGSLSFIDMLRERNKLHLLKKVTLVEPSIAALKRATINVQKATNGSILVLPIKKYLPGYGVADEIEGIDYIHSHVIHVFSNILDITSVNLEKLAYMVGTQNRTHHIMCMGPKNTNSYRIDKFCSAFNVSKDAYSSRIDNPCYGHTSDTNHNFSCVTRCLTYNGEGININNMAMFVEPTLIGGQPIYDDYDPMLAVQNNIISKDICDLYTYLGKKLNHTDHVYLKPTINGDTPDIVILRPGAGIMVIKVFEENINNYEFCINDKDGKIDYHNMSYDKLTKTSPIVIVQAYQQNLIQLHIKDMLGKSLIERSYWSVIKTVVYFSKNSTSEVEQKFKEAKYGYTTILGKDILSQPDFDFLKKTRFNYTTHLFDESIYKSFLRVISPKWHSYKEGKHLNLTTPQKRLAKSEPSPRRKINGVAGSGKTQVLAVRAVNANLRTGNKVLVLTFNLSLVNYIKYRIDQVRADFSWDMFFIVNYHQLFISEANNHGLRMNLTSFEDTNFFDSVAGKIKKYSTILIDEVQDYQTAWLNILNKYFLEPKGEIVVFGDAKQNIYHRPLDQNGQVRIGFISGEWNNSLNTGFRFNNPQLTSLAIDFQKAFFPSEFTDTIQQEATLAFNTCIKYYNVGRNVDARTLDSNCRWILQEFNIYPKDAVILSQTCDILRDLDYSYRCITKCETMSTFETKEQYDRLKQIHHIVNDDSPITFKFRNDIKQIRRNKKIHFSMNTSALKLSTIHSYKGWESPTVILILAPEQKSEKTQYAVKPDENDAELIYTAITRCKENLFILNCGNEKYHQFFYNFCNK